ncbi:MAG: flavodoxin [Lachnospiraceae bacterium]|nr:flavodoxin [Lachnospiraceae bacterium]
MEDLNWNNRESHSSLEMNSKVSRPPLADKDAGIEKYDVIFLGFPIWWYTAPRIINTFLESYDFSGRQIILFATSGGSGFGKTKDDLKVSISKLATIMEGGLLNGKQTKESLRSWVERL